jgi:DhnA family fructose-bisphosphate aldolase class Ia
MTTPLWNRGNRGRSIGKNFFQAAIATAVMICYIQGVISRWHQLLYLLNF